MFRWQDEVLELDRNLSGNSVFIQRCEQRVTAILLSASGENVLNHYAVTLPDIELVDENYTNYAPLVCEVCDIQLCAGDQGR